MGYDCYTRPRADYDTYEEYQQAREENPHTYFRRNIWGGVSAR